MNNIDPLAKLFGSTSRLKIMRLFLFTPETPQDVDDVSKKTNVNKRTASNDLRSLQSAGLLKSKIFVKTSEKKVKNKVKKTKKKIKGFVLNDKFKYLLPLQNLLIKGEPLNQDGIEKKFKNAGSIKLLIISGVFINERDARVDIMIVGDRLSDRSIETAIKNLESDIGTELKYAVFDTKEFQYRTNIYDKLIRDILESPHEKIVNRLGL